MIKIFGFRNMEITHFIEGYLPNKDEFASRELNCYTWPTTRRYPIEGLVTDKGFYDVSRTISGEIRFSLGILRALSAQELTAIFLHELGHNIDPALVDIRYIETNVLAKYLMDRKGTLNKAEQKIANAEDGKPFIFILIYFGLYFGILAIQKLYAFIASLFFDPEKAIEKIRNRVKDKKAVFDRVNNQEAFADNFARMYGFGGALLSALEKINRHYDEKQNSRIKREKARQREVAVMVIQAMDWTPHQTDIHRIHNLIREYEKDMKDPNIPANVKDDMKEDMDELKAVLDKYTNEYDNFQNTVNKIIMEELEVKAAKEEKEKPEKTSDEEKNDDSANP
jgi:hypothetical protein